MGQSRSIPLLAIDEARTDAEYFCGTLTSVKTAAGLTERLVDMGDAAPPPGR